MKEQPNPHNLITLFQQKWQHIRHVYEYALLGVYLDELKWVASVLPAEHHDRLWVYSGVFSRPSQRRWL